MAQNDPSVAYYVAECLIADEDYQEALILLARLL